MHKDDPAKRDLPSRVVVQSCHALPDTMVTDMMENIPLGVILIHEATASVYANKSGAQLLEQVSATFDNVDSSSRAESLGLLRDAANKEGGGWVTIQPPGSAAPTLRHVKRFPLHAVSPKWGDWIALCIEPECCENLLDCPTVRLWLPLIRGKANTKDVGSAAD